MAITKRYDFSALTALCVDDSKFFLEVFTDILRAFGVKRISSAFNAAEALKTLERDNPDIVFIDWEMGNDTCEDFLKAVRGDSRHPMRTVPVVLLTGYTDMLRIRAARDLGVNEFIVKPISAKILHMRLIKLIENPRKFYMSQDFFGPDRRRRQEKINFPDRRGVLERAE